MKLNLEEKNVKWGLTAFLVILCGILIFFAVYRFDCCAETDRARYRDPCSVYIRTGDGISAVSGIQLYGAKRLWDADTGRTEDS